jgi:outer membrane receptor protein involved in Fe transport
MCIYLELNRMGSKFFSCKGLPFILYAMILISGIAFGGTTGKIAGVVRDAKTNEFLPGANIILEGTTMGAATSVDGAYIILNVPPGNYTLRASVIGYRELRVENVHVSIDLTTHQDFSLEETVLEAGETVTIVATRPMVVKDLTASTAVVGSEEIENLPITEINEAVQLQAGLVQDAGGGLHIRGGRTGEISYWIDGIPVTDVYNGGSVVEVNKNMVQELQVVSGAFNAEYGQAMSGIVNIATKDGTNDFGGSVSAYFGDHVSTHKEIFNNIDAFSPTAVRDAEGSLNGAILKDKLFFYINGRYDYDDGYIYGQRRFNPQAVTTPWTLADSVLKERAPEYYNAENQVDQRNNQTFEYVVGSNAFIDSLITVSAMDEALRANPDSFAVYYPVYYNRLRENHKNGKGDMAYVPMNYNEKYYGQAKLIYKFTPSLKLLYNLIYDDVQFKEWSIFDNERDYKYNPDGSPTKYSLGMTHIVQLTHALSSTTFYTLGLSYFTKTFDKYLYKSDYDPRWVHPDLALQQPYSFKTAGTSGTDVNSTIFKRKTKTMLAKLDLTSQVTSTHQIKTGIEFRQHDVRRRDYTLRPVEQEITIDPVFDSPFISTQVLPESTIYNSSYKHNPREFSAYIQDKMEFKNMIVNLGVRLDYFDPDGVVLVDESDPSIYNPIRPENRYKDWGTDGIPNTHDPDGTESNGIKDPGEPSVTLAERQTYWYKQASTKMNISPRIGFSFPITDHGMIYFSYGHFFQVPRFERLYQNPDFELDSGTGNVGIIGNADLKPEKTVSGEIGLQQQLSDDIAISITGYFRDVRNLTSTRADDIEIFGGSATYSKFVNSDFGLIKGIIFSLNKRFSGGLSATLDYTLQQAKGSNSDPEAARNAVAGGSLPEVQLTPLDWDQKHTINATVTYSTPSYGGSLIARWGSGLPYTPRRSEDITTLLTNSQRKPSSYSIDLRAYKKITLGARTLTLFMRVFNLFDTLNEINVFDDTGRAGFTTDIETAQATNPTQAINTLEDWFTNATHYSEPRRIEAGFSYDF